MSLFDDHVSPVDVVDHALLVGDSCKGVGVVGPEDLGHLFGQLQSPLHLLPHRVEHHDLRGVQ